MASQGLPATEAAFAAGLQSMSSSNWNPIYLAATVNSYIQGGFSVVTTAPVAVAIPPADVTPLNYLTTPSPTFTITYTDDVALNPASINSAQVTVTGSGGLTLPVSLVGTSGSGASITATYQVSAPGGDWTTVPNGTFVISLAGGQVSDTSGNTIPAESLGTFQVTVNADPNPPVAAATTPIKSSPPSGSTSPSISCRGATRRAIEPQLRHPCSGLFDSNFTQRRAELPPHRRRNQLYRFRRSSSATHITTSSSRPTRSAPRSPTAAASATILPPGPSLTKVILNDGNAARTAITSATLVFSSAVTVNPTMVSLVQNPLTNPVPISIVVSNPTGDGKMWIVNWSTALPNNALPDGPYSLTVHGGSIADAYGQTAGGDQTTNFTAADGPVVTAAVDNNSAPPHSLSFTFSTDVSASLAASPLTALRLSNSASTVIPAASYSCNPATLTATWTYSGALPDGNYTRPALSARSSPTPTA